MSHLAAAKPEVMKTGERGGPGPQFVSFGSGHRHPTQAQVPITRHSLDCFRVPQGVTDIFASAAA
jgi:hypothetical protein